MESSTSGGTEEDEEEENAQEQNELEISPWIPSKHVRVCLCVWERDRECDIKWRMSVLGDCVCVCVYKRGRYL